eukprot:TRINITY_DN4446_c0_g1_i1.p1 TRINITY_DN4446_c0_g1~~TRINITY_DN4446_c0_g1_i1.p1  ORF type:complete len:319 (-),score=90.68 TRINITY_DN4446_c0_g1_i1:84-1040(-)
MLRRVGLGFAAVLGVAAVGGYYQFNSMIRGNVRSDISSPALSSEEVAARLKGKRVLVVGGTSGLGLSIAKAMAKREAQVTVVGRRNPNAEGLVHIAADLSTVQAMEDLASISVTNPQDIDIVLCTQGILAPPKRQVTVDGIEKDLAVSYVSRFVVLNRLISRGLKGKIYVMGFAGAEEKGNLDDFNGEKNYNSMTQHMNTVVANDALTIGLARRNPDLSVFGLNPGLIVTEIRSNVYDGNATMEWFVESLLGLFTPTADQYGELILPVFVTDLRKPGEEIFFNQRGQPVHKSQFLSDDRNVQKVWTETERLLAQAKRN